MSIVIDFKKEKLSEITKETFKEAIFLAYKDGVTSVAPLGFSGNTIILHGSSNEKTSRVSQVSVRNYSGDAELLITDIKGSFLFYGRFRVDLGIDFVAHQYWIIFKKVRKYILKEVPRISEFKDIEIPHNCNRSSGFDILHHAQLNYYKKHDSLLN
ncbi:MAG TPA: hypothetical protein PLJ18_11825 [Niabella sp.]|nr:hypothetical protein [Bacteroidia bacterium]HRB52066.1 hypothetical protein [Bacteroidia bacterium]HRC03134.1 hypothetical protein [Niabella sp.]